MNMKQNAALEMFRYLKEHLIPLAKDKNDKIFESDVTLQITRSMNKNIWDCEKEVKQLLSKTEARSIMISCFIDHVIINYSQNAQSLYIGSRCALLQIRNPCKRTWRRYRRQSINATAIGGIKSVSEKVCDNLWLQRRPCRD